MALNVVFRPEASAEVLETKSWYDGRADGLGGRFIDDLEAVLARVVERPTSFPTVRDQTRRAVLKRFPYAVYFRQTEGEIVVLAVHGRQDPMRWQSRT
ncbi:MAG: type II toxin-antitoxin system RelE/ParE family toxin [Acidobacteria bacterium]|nr:type II toxin-antitoxin system RelE/ParE family toxin [Acidobacteriota bacterium]